MVPRTPPSPRPAVSSAIVSRGAAALARIRFPPNAVTPRECKRQTPASGPCILALPAPPSAVRGASGGERCQCPLDRWRSPASLSPAAWLGAGHARLGQPHVPAIRIALIDRNHVALDGVELAAGVRHGRPELGQAVAAVALGVHLDDFDFMVA